MAGRDHQIRVLVSMILREKPVWTREQAMLWVLGYPPGYRRKLFQALYARRRRHAKLGLGAVNRNGSTKRGHAIPTEGQAIKPRSGDTVAGDAKAETSHEPSPRFAQSEDYEVTYST